MYNNKPMDVNAVEKLKIPDTRLPFVNTEISEINFRGERCLVSSVWAGAAGGRLYFWNLDTGTHDYRLLPGGIPGTYMLKEGPDGKLYIGCGNGDLIRYDPVADDFQVLVAGELHSITWGGCVTDRYVVWAASPGEVGVYDWRNEKLVKVFRPLDTETSTALYGHSAVEAPDGKVIVGMNIPQSRLIVLDLETMEPLSRTPEALLAGDRVYDLAFFTEKIFGFPCGNEILLFSYPEIDLQQRIPGPQGTKTLRGRLCARQGEYYAVAHPADTLLRLDRERGCFEVIAENWTGGCVGATGTWREKDFCAVTVAGDAFRYTAESGSTDHLDLEAMGLLPAHALCAAPQTRTILGAPFINQRFWTIDLETGEGRDRSRAAPGGGQINQIVWDPVTTRFMLSSYTSCSVTAFDPSREAVWPDNPAVLASAHDQGQMRPMALAHDGTHIWMATSPEYGTLGGALCRINPRTGSIDTWRHIVPDQKINALVLDPNRKRVYCSSEIYADCNSAPPTATTARLVSFCMETLTVLRSDIVREEAPGVKALGLLEDGNVLVQEAANLHAWDPETGAITDLGPAPGFIRSALSWTPDYGMLISADGSISRVTVKDGEMQLEELIEEDGTFLQIADDKLWYACEDHICSVELRLLSGCGK